MKYKLGIILLSLCNLSFAQAPAYYFSDQIDSVLKADQTGYKYQTASWNYSFIGEYFKALELKDAQYPNAKKAEAGAEQAAFFSKFKAIDAYDAILKEAAQRQIIMVNEAHHMPLHRVFMTRLLKDLKRLGYHYMGMEALAYEDTLLNKRTYPILSTGYYIKEPSYGNLIRTAIKTGYELFPYEQKTKDSLQMKLSREEAQAQNIQAFMKALPDAKLIIYCGYDHLVKDTLRNFMGLPMAGRLKHLTGIDPFCIDQTALAEFVVVGNRYRSLMHENKASFFVDSAGHYFNQASLPKVLDVNLFFPDTKLVQGRPEWLLNKDNELVQLQDKIRQPFPYLIKIYLATDDTEQAVPLDVIEIKSASDHKASLLLKRQKQIAVVISRNGEKEVLKLK